MPLLGRPDCRGQSGRRACLLVCVDLKPALLAFGSGLGLTQCGSRKGRGPPRQCGFVEFQSIGSGASPHFHRTTNRAWSADQADSGVISAVTGRWIIELPAFR